MIEPRRALVRPRAHSPVSGELLLLEEEILPLVESLRTGGIAIVGPPGSGKTTALAHLAAVLPTRDHLRFFDEPDLDELRLPIEGHLVIFTFSGDLPREFCHCFRLAGWDRDDWIEYLLATHKDRCSAVLSRIQPADRALLMGNPELWSIVLETLAADETLPTGRTALLRQIDERLADPEDIRRVEDGCLDCLVRFGVNNWLLVVGKTDPKRQVLRHDAVQILLTARRIAADLTAGTPGEYLSNPWPRNLVEMSADALAGNHPARENLERIVERREQAQPMTASLLCALDREWRPRINLINLCRAYLGGVKWAAVPLKSARLFGADLSEADLRAADMRKSDIRNANLWRADLSGAKLTHAFAQKADFRHANLTGIQAYQAHFEDANLSRAICEKAVFREAILEGAILKHGSFRSTNFAHAMLARAKIKSADFCSANFQGADLSRLCLRTALCTGADFREANLTGCDLESMELPEANFEECQLPTALLTGSVMRGANFRNANLRQTGLGDIDWENADLRGADLRGASFHLGSTRSGLVGSPIASEGTSTGFYTDDFSEQDFKSPEEIRKANLRGADLRGARLEGVDFYLVDLRGAHFDPEMETHFRRCGAILEDRGR